MIDALTKVFPMASTSTSPYPLVCFSHLRWNFVRQRPHHLMRCFSRTQTVYFVEEALFDADSDRLEVLKPSDNLWVLIPHLKNGTRREEGIAKQKEMLAAFFIAHDITQYIFWYYTPMAVLVSDHFNPSLVVYDCMEEPTASPFASQTVSDREKELLRRADLVFTAGYSLYEAKKNRHPDVHVFPSGIDVDHFGQARLYTNDPPDQARIPHPRIGYFGVIDERIDVTLLEGIATRKPEWHIVMVGPVARINPGALPKLPNIHYLGKKTYDELPAYIAGWDIAMVPFAHNESTRYVSPTKTPEYLAAGKPVISTPVTDVLRQYGRTDIVNIAGTAEEFVRVASLELENNDRDEWLERVDELLSRNSWDKIWQRMMYLITRKLNEKERQGSVNEHIYV